MSERKLDDEDAGQGPLPLTCDLFAEDPGFPPDEGPKTRDQMWRWQCFALDRVKRAGLIQNVLDKFCEHGVVLSTDYSGVGTAEAALSYIHTALKRMGYPDNVEETVAGEPAVRISAVGDVSVHCRAILGNRKEDDMFSPECIFGSILERAPQMGLLEVKELLQTYRMRKDYQLKTGKISEEKILKRLGRDFVREAWRTLIAAEAEEGVPETAYCYKHRKQCSFETDLSTNPRAFEGHVAGPMCVDFSGLGSGLGWLGDTSVPFVVWLREKVRTPVQWFVLENVESFDDSLVAELASAVYDITVLTIDPYMFGVPVTRSRKYLLMKLRGCVEWVHQVEKDPTTAFHTLFGRPHSVDGRIFYSAPEEIVGDTHKAIARQKNMAETQANGAPWPSKLLMTHQTRERVKQWEEKCRKVANLGRDQTSFFVMNTTQGCSRSPCVTMIPALIRNSTLFSMLHQRNMLLPEMFEVQGFPVFVPRDCPYVCPFRDVLVDEDEVTGQLMYRSPPPYIRAMAGNGMHVQAVGHAILFLLACTKVVGPANRRMRFFMSHSPEPQEQPDSESQSDAEVVE